MSLKKKILVIVFSFFTLFSLMETAFVSYLASTHYMLQFHEAAYMHASETVFNDGKFSLEENESINSVKITIVNESNKDFLDLEVRAMYYNDYHSSISYGNSDFTYPEGYSLYKKIDVMANETKVVEFTEFRNVWHYKSKFRVAFEYVYNQNVGSEYEDSALMWYQLDYGNEFKNYFKPVLLSAIVGCSLITVGCATVVVVVLVKNKKNKKDF